MLSLASAIGVALLTSFALVYVLLVALFRSYRLPFVILISVPLASIGSFGVLWLENALHTVFPDADFLSGQTLNLYSMLGLLMLMGLVAKNGILLVDYANTMRLAGLSAVEAIRAAASARFRPIVMTTLAMIAGMLPLALGFTAGAEIRKAMGSVIIGGLASSLVLT